MAKITRKSMNKSVVVRVADNTNLDAKVANQMLKYQSAIDNGTITRERLKDMKAVDMSNCVRPISVLQLNYNPVNLIGPATTAMTNFVTIDVEKDMDGFKSMLAELEVRDNHTAWTTIWKEGYNMFREFNLVTGQRFTIYVVTNEEIKAFANQVKALNADQLTVEDAIQMQFDFRPIVRAFQESYIDVVKDKTKKFDLDYTDIINSVAVKSAFIKKHSAAIDFNFNAVKAAKRARKAMPKFEFSLEAEVNGQVKNYDDIASDLISRVNATAIDASVNFLNGSIMDAYKTSDDSEMLNSFINYAPENKELALFIKQVYKMLNNAIFNDKATVAKEEYALYRDVIYTKAAELQVEECDVVKVAISTAMSNVYMNKDKEIKVSADMERFSDVHVKNIFVNEFAIAISEAQIGEELVMREALDLNELEFITRDIEDGETIEFRDGEALDGSIKFNNDFTGFVTECDGELLYEVNAYKHEFVEAIIIDETFKADVTVKDLKVAVNSKNMDSIRDLGQALDNAVSENALTHLSIAGQNNNIIMNDTTKKVVGLIKVATNAKGHRVVADIKSYKAKNNHQQLFLVIFE